MRIGTITTEGVEIGMVEKEREDLKKNILKRLDKFIKVLSLDVIDKEDVQMLGSAKFRIFNPYQRTEDFEGVLYTSFLEDVEGGRYYIEGKEVEVALLEVELKDNKGQAFHEVDVWLRLLEED